MTNTHIWVTQEFADKYNELETDKAQLSMVTDVINRKKIDIESELNQLDEDLVRFKAGCLLHKTEMQKVYDEQNDKLESLINNMWDVMPNAKKNAQKMADEIQPFADKVTDLGVAINKIKSDASGINFYGLDTFLKVAETIKHMDSESKEMLKFMMSNYTKQTKDNDHATS